MHDWDEIRQTGTAGPAFSNGFEYHAWAEAWCDRCVHWPPDPADGGCPLVGVAIVHGLVPAEWIEDEPFGLRDRYRCAEFTAREDGT